MDDMSIIAKNQHVCVICPRYNAKCKRITTSSGGEISWANYLTISWNAHLCSPQELFSICDAKKQFYRSFNCIFGKIGCIASANVIVELLKMKCLPGLYCGCVFRWSVAETTVKRLYHCQYLSLLNDVAIYYGGADLPLERMHVSFQLIVTPPNCAISICCFPFRLFFIFPEFFHGCFIGFQLSGLQAFLVTVDDNLMASSGEYLQSIVSVMQISQNAVMAGALNLLAQMQFNNVHFKYNCNSKSRPKQSKLTFNVFFFHVVATQMCVLMTASTLIVTFVCSLLYQMHLPATVLAWGHRNMPLPPASEQPHRPFRLDVTAHVVNTVTPKRHILRRKGRNGGDASNGATCGRG